MAAADGEFASLDAIAAAEFDPAADGVAVRTFLAGLELDEVADVLRVVAPKASRFFTVDDEDVDRAVEIEVRQRCAARLGET